MLDRYGLEPSCKKGYGCHICKCMQVTNQVTFQRKWERAFNLILRALHVGFAFEEGFELHRMPFSHVIVIFKSLVLLWILNIPFMDKK